MILKTVKFFADKAYRTILTCYRDMSMDQFRACGDPESEGFAK